MPTALRASERRATSLNHGKEAPDILRIAVAQLNPTVGDVAGNLAKAREARADAARQGADLVLFTELFICRLSAGGPGAEAGLPEGLRRRRTTLPRTRRMAARASSSARRCKRKSGRHNSVVVADGGKILPSATRSTCRTTASSTRSASSRGRTRHAGADQFPRRAARHPDLRGYLGRCRRLRDAGRERRGNDCWCPTARPTIAARSTCATRWRIRQVIESGLPLVFANQLGGQDELIFDGASFAIQADKSLAFQMSQFEETLVVTAWKRDGETAGSAWTGRCRASPRRKRPITAPACWACATM